MKIVFHEKYFVYSNDPASAKGRLDGPYRILKEAEQAQDHIAPLPPGDFNIIYADPPWQYLAS